MNNTNDTLGKGVKQLGESDSYRSENSDDEWKQPNGE